MFASVYTPMNSSPHSPSRQSKGACVDTGPTTYLSNSSNLYVLIIGLCLLLCVYQWNIGITSVRNIVLFSARFYCSLLTLHVCCVRRLFQYLIVFVVCEFLFPAVSEPVTNRGVLLSTLLQDILHPSHLCWMYYYRLQMNWLFLKKKKVVIISKYAVPRFITWSNFKFFYRRFIYVSSTVTTMINCRFISFIVNNWASWSDNQLCIGDTLYFVNL
jgi:hypothetical protein